MKKIFSTLTVQNKKYTYSLTQKSDEIVLVECEAARIKQDFLKEDVVDLLIDLPNLIIAEKEQQARQNDIVRFRVSAEDKSKIEKKAIKAGFQTVSDYLRHIALA